MWPKLKQNGSQSISIIIIMSNTYTMYQYLAKKLNHFRMRYQRKLLKIKWHDKIPDTDVLAQANLSGKGQPVSDMFVTVIQNRALCHKNIRTLWKPKQDSQTTSRQSDNRQ